MRTTVSIDDELLARAKVRAREKGQTLGEVLEEALRTSLAMDRAPATPVTIPVFTGGSGLAPGIEASTRGLLEALDTDVPLDQLR